MTQISWGGGAASRWTTAQLFIVDLFVAGTVALLSASLLREGISGLVEFVAITIPLLFRRIFPAVVCLTILAAALVYELATFHDWSGPIAGWALIVALYTATSKSLTTIKHILLSGCLFLLLVAHFRAHQPWAATLASSIPLVAGWLAGEATAFRAAYLRERRKSAAAAQAETNALLRAAAAEERNRIANDMHDIVSHAVMGMIINAEGAYRIFASAPEQSRRSMRTIAEQGREAIGELKTILGQLQSPAHSLGLRERIEEITALCRNGRRTVHLRVDDSLALPSVLSGQLDYVIREAVTNISKHAAPDADVDISVHEDGASVRVDIVNGPGTEPPVPPPPGTSSGLLGIRQRAERSNGTAHYGPTDAGGFRVSAVFPWEKS